MLGLLLVSSQSSLGALLGGLIIIFNFHWFQKALRKVFDPQMVYGTKMFYYAKYFLRLVITAVAIYLLIVYRTVHPLGLLTGLSVVVMNIMLIAFNELRKIIRTKEAI